MAIVEVFLKHATDIMNVAELYDESQSLGVAIQRNQLLIEDQRSYLFQLIRSNLIIYDRKEESVSFCYDSVFEYLIAVKFSDRLSKSLGEPARHAIIDDLVARLIAVAYPS